MDKGVGSPGVGDKEAGSASAVGGLTEEILGEKQG